MPIALPCRDSCRAQAKAAWAPATGTNGRRSYLYAGGDSGGERAGVIYSLIGTAKLNGVDPEAWLLHVLVHGADHPVNCVHDFLP
ncbi:transposase IS66-like protein [Janthinobacterium sp. 75]|nr:transposase IS66-like protein [Janthinobacterium sp. 75]